MEKNDMAMSIVELSDTDLDAVAAGATTATRGLNLSNLVSINLPINIGVGLQGQVNTAVFSLAMQGGVQNLNLSAFAFA